MAGATFSTRMKLSAKGKKKYYVCMSFDGRKTERFGGYSEADAYQLGIKLAGDFNQNRAGVMSEPTKPFMEMVDAFCARKIDRSDRPIKANTAEHNQQQMEKFIFGVKDNEGKQVIEGTAVASLKSITKQLLVTWSQTLKEAGNMPNTININLKVVKCFLNVCVDKGWLDASPFPRKLMSTYHSTGHYYTEDERKKLLSPTLSNDPQRIRADRLLVNAIKIAQTQGLRLSQIWQLRMCDYRENDNRVFTIGLKKKDDKFVLCHPVTLMAMKDSAALNESGPTERVFKNWGSPLTMSQAFRRKRKEVGIAEGRFHDNKHTSVSELKRQGFSNVEIEDITNTDRKTLDSVYTHADEEKLRDKFSRFRIGGA